MLQMATIESLYEEDFYAWTQQQAALLRRLPPLGNELNLEDPADHWRDEIVEWRIQLEQVLTHRIVAELDLPACYRTALGLIRRLERYGRG
jgi:hypothetical protein